MRDKIQYRNQCRFSKANELHMTKSDRMLRLSVAVINNSITHESDDSCLKVTLVTHACGSVMATSYIRVSPACRLTPHLQIT